MDAVLLEPGDAGLEALQAIRGRFSATFVASVRAPGRPGLEWVAGGGIDALGRAVLLASGDVLLLGPGVQLRDGDLSLMASALALSDRTVAVVPVATETPVDASSVAGLPAAAELFGVDVACVLIRGDALALVGGLDSAFSTPIEALTDWVLRAQRLGFVTVRALRAQCRATDVAFPEGDALTANHVVWPHLRELSLQAVESQLARQVSRRARGPLRVCLDLRHLPHDTVNGTVVYARELTRALVAHGGLELAALVDTDAQRSLVATFGLEAHLALESSPLAQVVHRPAQIFVASQLDWLLRYPASLVVTFQDLIAWRVPSILGEGGAFERYRVISRVLTRSAQAVVALSAHNARELVAEFGLPPERVHQVPHGVDSGYWAARDSLANRVLLETAGVQGPYFFFGGADYPHKNHRLMLAAFAQLRARWVGPGPMPSLVLTGQQSNTSGSVYSVLNERLPPGVRYLGLVAEPLLRALYQEAIAVLYPSVYEGFGLPVLEAMACGVPVVTSTYSSLPEITQGAATVVSPLTDRAFCEAMLELATDEKHRAALSLAGRARSQAFTWAETARRTIAVYESALAAPSGESLEERRFGVQMAAAFRT